MPRPLLLSLLLLTLAVTMAAGSEYEAMAVQLTRRASVEGSRVAVLPFFYSNGGGSDEIVSKRLESELAQQGRVRVVECEVSAILDEQERQHSGAFALSTIQRWGELSGAEAVVTGRLTKRARGRRVEINARLISVRTAEVLGAAKTTVSKDWDVEDEDEEEEASLPRRRRQAEDVKYFEVFFGRGIKAPAMDLQFKNNGSHPIYTGDLGIYSSGGSLGPLTSVKWSKLKTSGVGPVSIRVVGFGADKPLGAAFGVEWERRTIAPQRTSFKLNDYGPFPFMFHEGGYLTVNSLSLTYNLMLRFTTDFLVEPYIGVGVGLSLNTIHMPHVKGYTNSSFMSAPTDDFGIGFLFPALAGIRLKVSDQLNLVGEIKAQKNTIRFDRGLPGEKDSLCIKGVYVNLGAGVRF
ncbi:MAG: FlgO family outer membrane protein [Elusimicrobiales bacterium]